jgi:hypothetical protein
MIFAFVEGGSLEIKRDLSEVRRDFEAVDVENLVVDGARFSASSSHWSQGSSSSEQLRTPGGIPSK